MLNFISLPPVRLCSRSRRVSDIGRRSWAVARRYCLLGVVLVSALGPDCWKKGRQVLARRTGTTRAGWGILRRRRTSRALRSWLLVLSRDISVDLMESILKSFHPLGHQHFQ